MRRWSLFLRRPLSVLAVSAALVTGMSLTGAASASTAVSDFSAAGAVLNADGSYTVSWTAEHTSRVSVTLVASPAATRGSVLGQGRAADSLTLTVPASSSRPRAYFRLTTNRGQSLVVADRSLHLPDANNARDLGDYRTTDGHWVRPGLLYRSNKLSDLTAAEWSTLTSLHVNLDVDLRNIEERAEDPDNPPVGVDYDVADVVGIPSASLPSFLDCSLLPSLINSFIAIAGTSDPDKVFTAASYPLMVCYSGAEQAFHDLLTDIANDDTGAVLFHCTAGKDRTGWGAAVLLTILGVPRGTINADFMASNTYHGANSVDQAWLDAGFNEVDQAFGSFDNYVHRGLRLDDATIAKLRAKLLTTTAPDAR